MVKHHGYPNIWVPMKRKWQGYARNEDLVMIITLATIEGHDERTERK